MELEIRVFFYTNQGVEENTGQRINKPYGEKQGTDVRIVLKMRRTYFYF